MKPLEGKPRNDFINKLFLKTNERLLKDILRGNNVIYAPSRFGKTVACIQAMVNNSILVLVTYSVTSAKELLKEYPLFEKNRIMSWRQVAKLNKKDSLTLRNHIIDEADWCPVVFPDYVKIHCKISAAKNNVIVYGEASRLELDEDCVCNYFN